MGVWCPKDKSNAKKPGNILGVPAVSQNAGDGAGKWCWGMVLVMEGLLYKVLGVCMVPGFVDG